MNKNFRPRVFPLEQKSLRNSIHVKTIMKFINNSSGLKDFFVNRTFVWEPTYQSNNLLELVCKMGTRTGIRISLRRNTDGTFNTMISMPGLVTLAQMNDFDTWKDSLNRAIDEFCLKYEMAIDDLSEQCKNLPEDQESVIRLRAVWSLRLGI